VLFGFGGQLTEVFRDTAIALTPLDAVTADVLVGRRRISKALAGTLGRPPVDRAQLVKTIVRFAQLVEEFKEIAECDINPLLATDKEIVALDARNLLKTSQSPSPHG
jgi:acetyltransferase